MLTQVPVILLSGALLVAQLPDATPKEMGAWIISGAAVLAIGLLGKSLFFRDRPPGDRSVTRDELASSLGRYSTTEVTAGHVPRVDLAALETRLVDRDRKISAEMEGVRLSVAVLEVSQGHQSRLLASIADRLGVDHPPGEERRSRG